MSQSAPRSCLARKRVHCAHSFSVVGMVLISCAGLILMTSCQSPADPPISRPALADAQYTADGTEGCLRCHGGDRMTLIAATPHGDKDNPHAPSALHGCESCHGPGSLHVSRARGGTGLPALLSFGDRKTRPLQTEACLDCHAQDMGDSEGMQWTGSLHDTPRTTCVSCHVVHTEVNPMTDKTQQTANCMRCHEEEIANHRRFKNKDIVLNELSCYDCHNVHQLAKKPEPE